MKNFVSQGNTLEITAAADIASGDGVLTGALCGVAAGDMAPGATGIVHVTGVYDLPKKDTQAWTVGAKIYWDDTEKHCTTTATDNTLIGAAVLAVGNTASEVVGRVRLNGTA